MPPTTNSEGPPDGGWGWLVCVACFVGNLINGAITMSFGVILPELKIQFGEGTGMISFVGSLLCGSVLMTMPLAAVFANKFGLRVTYITGSLLTSSALVVSTLFPNMPFFIVTYGVFNGTGLGFISLVISVACNHYFTKRRALAVGIGKTGISLASFIFPPLTNYVLNYGWKSVIYMYAGVALLSAFFGCLIRPLNSYSKVPSNEEGISTTMEPCDKIMENNVQRKEHSNEEPSYDFNYNANKEKQNTALYEVEKLHIDELSNENTDNLYKHILDTESSITKKRDSKKKVTQFKN